MYNKLNQRLKYLNKGSTHKSTVFYTIPKGVFYQLVSLTTFNNLNKDKMVDELYPIHTKTLRNAGLIHNEFPILSQCLQKASADEEAIKEDNNDSIEILKTKDLRSSYLSIGYCQYWNRDIYQNFLNV